MATNAALRLGMSLPFEASTNQPLTGPLRCPCCTGAVQCMHVARPRNLWYPLYRICAKQHNARSKFLTSGDPRKNSAKGRSTRDDSWNLVKTTRSLAGRPQATCWLRWVGKDRKLARPKPLGAMLACIKRPPLSGRCMPSMSTALMSSSGLPVRVVLQHCRSWRSFETCYSR